MNVLKQGFIVSCLCFLITGCALFGFDNEEEVASADEMYEEAQTAMKKNNYEEAIRHLESLETQYPFGKYAEKAQLDLVYAYYKADDQGAAVAAADRFIRLHPYHERVDYAYYLKGLVRFESDLTFFQRWLPLDIAKRDPGQARQAFDDFAELLRRFPDSQYAAEARQRMVYLRNAAAQHEIYVAEYYLKHKAYLAAANRAKAVVENFPRTPAVKRAIEILITSYKELGLHDLASTYEGLKAVN